MDKPKRNITAPAKIETASEVNAADLKTSTAKIRQSPKAKQRSTPAGKTNPTATGKPQAKAAKAHFAGVISTPLGWASLPIRLSARCDRRPERSRAIKADTNSSMTSASCAAPGRLPLPSQVA